MVWVVSDGHFRDSVFILVAFAFFFIQGYQAVTPERRIDFDGIFRLEFLLGNQSRYMHWTQVDVHTYTTCMQSLGS